MRNIRTNSPPTTSTLWRSNANPLQCPSDCKGGRVRVRKQQRDISRYICPLHLFTSPPVLTRVNPLLLVVSSNSPYHNPSTSYNTAKLPPPALATPYTSGVLTGPPTPNTAPVFSSSSSYKHAGSPYARRIGTSHGSGSGSGKRVARLPGEQRRRSMGDFAEDRFEDDY